MTNDLNDVEVWTYLGRRQLVNGKLGYKWQPPPAVEGGALPPSVFYSGLKATAVGARYEVTVTARDEDGNPSSVQTGTRFVEAAPAGDEAAAGAALADHEAYLADQVRKAEARAARDTSSRIGDLTLREIRESLIRQGGPNRAARIALVLSYLNA